MRILMMGTGPFAVPSFRWLLESAHEVPALITRPARGRKPPPNPMRETAAAAGMPVYDPADINAAESHALLKELACELYLVCDYGQILSRETLAIPRLGGINLHGSLLPKYRGAAPINWAILEGETVTGVTVIHMTPRLDGGPMLSCQELAIGPRETAEDLEPRMAKLGVRAVQEAIELLAAWDGESELGTPQDRTLVSKAPRLSKEQAAIDWSKPARQLANQVRAFQPWPGTYFTRPLGEREERVIVLAASVVELSSRAQVDANVAPGTVIAGDGESLEVATGEGVLSIEEVQPAGKKPMPAAAYLRGKPLLPGVVLG